MNKNPKKEIKTWDSTEKFAKALVMIAAAIGVAIAALGLDDWLKGQTEIAPLRAKSELSISTIKAESELKISIMSAELSLNKDIKTNEEITVLKNNFDAYRIETNKRFKKLELLSHSKKT